MRVPNPIRKQLISMDPFPICIIYSLMFYMHTVTCLLADALPSLNVVQGHDGINDEKGIMVHQTDKSKTFMQLVVCAAEYRRRDFLFSNEWSVVSSFPLHVRILRIIMRTPREGSSCNKARTHTHMHNTIMDNFHQQAMQGEKNVD